MDFSLVTDHVDYEEIVSKIVTGTSAKEIAQWLKVKYPAKEQKHLALGQKLLQDFMDKHLDLQAKLAEDLSVVKSKQLTGADPKILNSLSNNKSYQERLIELATEEIDVKKLVRDLVLLCKARMEQVFDKIQENPTSGKSDYTLIKYFETLFNAVEKYDKIVNNAPDQVIQHNVTIQTIEEHTALFQEAVRETLAQMDSEAALLFIEIFTEKLNRLKAPKNEFQTLDQRKNQAEILREVVIPALEEKIA